MGLSAPPLTALISPEPVRHSRIPDLPLDSSLLFEFLLFLYLLVALFVQYINIYRTVWWYPYSQPAASTSLVRPHTLATYSYSVIQVLLNVVSAASKNHPRQREWYLHVFLLSAVTCLLRVFAELPLNGLPFGCLHHSYASQETGVDYHLRGLYENTTCWLLNSTFIVFGIVILPYNNHNKVITSNYLVAQNENNQNDCDFCLGEQASFWPVVLWEVWDQLLFI